MQLRPVNSPDVMIVDGLNLCFKVFYGIGSQTLSVGQQNVGIIYGFIKSIHSYIGQFFPKSLVIAWEGRRGKYRRKNLYTEYKEKRELLDQEVLQMFFEQVRIIEEYIDYAGLVGVSVDSWEADDTMFSLAKQCSERGLTSCTVTSDEDLLQVVDEFASWYNPTLKKYVNWNNFEEIVGVPRERYVDYKILLGDSSDNIEGVPGIGEKTASKLLSEGSLVDFINKGASDSKRLSVLFEKEMLEKINLNRKIIDLAFMRSPELDARVLNSWEDNQSSLDSDSLLDFFMYYDFNSYIKEFNDIIVLLGTVENEKMYEVLNGN